MSVYGDPDFYKIKPEESIYGRYFYSVCLGGFSFGAVAVTNYFRRRPVLTGIHNHVFAALVGAAVGEMAKRYSYRRAAENDAVLKHYMMLHPEDFVEPVKQKYNDVLLSWIPRR